MSKSEPDESANLNSERGLEERLRESQERFELAVRCTNDGIWDWDLATGDVYFSPRWKAMLGYENDEIAHRFEEWQSRVHPDDLPEVLEGIHRHLRGECDYYQAEFRMRHKDGSYRWILARGASLRDERGEPCRMAGSHTDITDRRQAEKALQLSEQRYRSLFEHHPDAVFACDRNGRFVSANERCYELSGYTVEELLQMSWPPLISSDVLDETLAQVRQAMEGVPARFESAIERKDGRRIALATTVTPIWVGEEIVGVYGIAHDISAQKRAEERLQEKEQQYRSIFESTSDGVVIAELDGRIVEANPAMCRMHGYKYEELVGADLTSIFGPGSLSVFDDFVCAVREGRELRAQAVDVRKDGSRLAVELHGSTVVYRGHPRMLAVVHDITEQVRTYELLEQRVEERTRELTTLLDLSHSVSSTLELRPLLSLIVEGLRDVTDYDGASLLLRDGDDLIFYDREGPGDFPDMVERRISIRRFQRAWELFESGQPLIIDDVRSDDPMAAAWRAALSELADTPFGYVRGWMGVPMVLKDRVLGLLAVSSAKPRYYTEHHASLAFAIAQQAAVAVENARLYEQAQRWAAAEERARLARELHDSVTQALFSMTLHARATHLQLEHEGVDPESSLAANVRQLSELTRGALAEMRALLFELRPGALREEGLIVALRKQATALGAREGLTIEVQTSVERVALDEDAEEHLYRLAQEALNNVAKHARATRIEIRVEESGDGLLLEISDDGIGFDPARATPGHMGLTTMAERAAKLGATFQVLSQPGRGTTVRVVTAPGPSGSVEAVSSRQSR